MPGNGGSDGKSPGSPDPSGAPPVGLLPGVEPQPASGVAGSGVMTRSVIARSGERSAGAGCPVSLQSVIGETSAGRAQSAGFLLP